ncbi:hypothetical protein BRC82_05985 [Halobacteriales archaeon QS_1_67_19]|nr:MAG: hypothetical protein BRC82_05985 [Halobacteriales archaeon QS_1_67_19]
MYDALHLVAPGLVLITTLAVGICVHELLHLLPLHLAGAAYSVTLLPADDADSSTPWTALQSALTSGLVRVEVVSVPDATPDWVLRTAAILPLALALPLALVAAGVLPDPLATGDYVGVAALIALTACGLPSPADWSVVWHGSELLEDR